MSDILGSIYQAIHIIVESAVKTSIKVLSIVFGVSNNFGKNAAHMSVFQLILYSLIIFGFVLIILKFLKNSIKSLFYFGLIALLLWLFFL